MKNKEVMFSHNTDNWKTPKEIMDIVTLKGFKDTFTYKSEKDEFLNEYHNQKLYCNPPYSKLKEVVKWLEIQIKNGCEILLNIPSRTDTRYFHELLKYNPLIYFIKGRLKFGEYQQSSAPFPSLFVYIYNSNKPHIYDGGSVEEFIRRYL